MRRWPELIGLALLAGPTAAAGSGGIPVVGEGALTAAAQSCVGLTADLGADRAMLNGRGWKKGTVSANGKPVDDESSRKLEFYGRDGILLMLGVEDKPSCLIMTKTKSPAERVEGLLKAVYGREPISRSGGNIVWILDGKQDVLLKTAAEGGHQLVTIVFTSTGQAQ
jgi:hypothetical protein